MTVVDLTALIKEHDWDELIFGGYLCLACTPDGDTDATAWPCPTLRAAGMTDAHAIAVIQNRRLRVELRDKGNDLLNIRGILWPNGSPSRAPEPEDISVVAPSVQWLVDEVERLRGQVDGRNEAISYNNREADRLRRYVGELEEQCDRQLAEIKQLRAGGELS